MRRAGSHRPRIHNEFVWVGDDAVDPLEQAQTLNILVSAGIKTRDEARADLWLAPEGGSGASGIAKYNHNHDERGRFATAEGERERKTRGGCVEPPAPADLDGSGNLVLAQDLTQSCAAYIAANCQSRVLRVFLGQYLTQSLQDVINAAKSGDRAARTAHKLLFNKEYAK